LKRFLYYIVFFIAALYLQSGMYGCAKPGDLITINVSAAASLTNAITEINKLFKENNNDVEVLAHFAASGDIQTQIENGAPIDVFISAAAKQMDSLDANGMIKTETRRNLLRNKIVLIVPRSSNLIVSGFESLVSDEFRRISIGDPDFVPAGYYALQTFELTGISYEKIQSKLLLAGNVMQVLSYVESGDVDAGIVFASDTTSSDAVRIVATAPDEINNNIIYPIAVIASSKNIEVSIRYIDYLYSAAAREIFEKHGFTVITE